MANPAEPAKEGYGSKKAVLPMMMTVMIADNGEDILDATLRQQPKQPRLVSD
jgi:hypothetical protein